MNFPEKLELLTRNLRKSHRVNSFDKPDERESETLAHALIDMEESFKFIVPKPKDISN